MSFYGVRRNEHTGVFDNWPDAEASLHMYRNNCVNKCSTFEAAEDFVYGTSATLCNDSAGNLEFGATGGSSPDLDANSFTKTLCNTPCTTGLCLSCDDASDDEVQNSLQSKHWLGEVYVNGCYFHNGDLSPRAGIGVYWGKDSPFNVSERLRGKQNSMRVELQAAKRAIVQATCRGFNTLFLYTNCIVFKESYENCLWKWEENNWMLSDGKTPVPNGKYWESLNDAIKDSGFDLNIIYTPTHKGITENEEAVRLAKLGANKPKPSADACIPAREELAMLYDSHPYKETMSLPRKRIVTEMCGETVFVVA